MRKNNPILINVPHSATYIPPEEMKYFTTPDLGHELAVMTDPVHTPKAAEQLLRDHFSGRRYSVEINRRLYIDHDIHKTNGYARIKRDVADAIEVLRDCV